MRPGTHKHSGFGSPECCVCLLGIVREDQQADIVCNECQAIIRTVALRHTENSQSGLFRRTLRFARAASKTVGGFLAWNNVQAEQYPGAPDSIKPGYLMAPAASKSSMIRRVTTYWS